jgi:hypothetical protein
MHFFPPYQPNAKTARIPEKQAEEKSDCSDRKPQAR